MFSRIIFAGKLHYYSPDFVENVLWTGDTKVEDLEGVCPVTSRGKKIKQHVRNRHVVKHGCGGVMVWDCFLTSVSG